MIHSSLYNQGFYQRVILKLQLQNDKVSKVAACRLCAATLALSFLLSGLSGFKDAALAAASAPASHAKKQAPAHRKGVTVEGSNAKAEHSEGILLDSMRKELKRSMAKLKSAGEAPLYFLSYAVYDTESLTLQSDYGGSYNDESNDHKRQLDIDLRVGDPKVDNTHKVRSSGFSFDFFDMPGGLQPTSTLEDDAAAIGTDLWLRTDAAFKAAQKKYRNVKTNRNVKVEEDDTSDDFSTEKPALRKGQN